MINFISHKDRLVIRRICEITVREFYERGELTQEQISKFIKEQHIITEDQLDNLLQGLIEAEFIEKIINQDNKVVFKFVEQKEPTFFKWIELNIKIGLSDIRIWYVELRHWVSCKYIRLICKLFHNHKK